MTCVWSDDCRIIIHFFLKTIEFLNFYIKDDLKEKKLVWKIKNFDQPLVYVDWMYDQ